MDMLTISIGTYKREDGTASGSVILFDHEGATLAGTRRDGFKSEDAAREAAWDTAVYIADQIEGIVNTINWDDAH